MALAVIDALTQIGWDVDLYLTVPVKPAYLSTSFGRPISVECRVRITKPSDKWALWRGRVLLDLIRNILSRRVEKCDMFVDMAPNQVPFAECQISCTGIVRLQVSLGENIHTGS